MNLPQVQHTNVSNFLNNEEVVKETIDQIKRDFEQFNLELKTPANLSNVYQDLLHEVAALITDLLARESSQLYALLYRIDISDQSMVKASLALPDYSHIEVIAHQIIFRDLQKVLTRRYFRQESSNKIIDQSDQD